MPAVEAGGGVVEKALPTGKMNAFVTGRPVRIEGPSTLYRFSGPARQGQVAGAGEWWIGEGVYRCIYDEARKLASGNDGSTTSTEFIRLYRERLAVSLDWNDLQSFFRMDIPLGGYVVGTIGAASGQPRLSFDGQHRLRRAVGGSYGGGGEQILIQYPAAEWTARADWIKGVRF